MRQKSPETYEEKLEQLTELRQAAVHSSPEAEQKLNGLLDDLGAAHKKPFVRQD